MALGRSFVSVLRRATAADADLGVSTGKLGKQKAVSAREPSRPDAAKRRADKTLAVAQRADAVSELAILPAGAAEPAAASLFAATKKIEGKAAARTSIGGQASRDSSAGAAGSRRVAASGDGANPSSKLVVMDLRKQEAVSGQLDKGRTGSRKPRVAEADAAALSDRGSARRGALALVLAPRSTERSSEARFPTARLEESASPSRLATSKTASQPPGRFSEILKDEVVRHASVVVRNGGEGEIRLLLKPESLGEVRIRMKVVDDSIKGQIVVRSAEARDLFQENLGTLEAALREQGFQNASLDVSVSDGNRGRPDSDGYAPLTSRTVAAEELERNGKVVLLADFGMHAVDMVV